MIMQNQDFEFDGDDETPRPPLNEQPGMMYGFVPKIPRPRVCFRFDAARTSAKVPAPHQAADESRRRLTSHISDTLFFG